LKILINKRHPKLLYVNPNFQNPSGITYSDNNRKEIAGLINSKETFLIEDDVVVTVCGHANETCPMYLKKAQIIHKGFDDPAQVTGSEEEILGQFRKVRDEIKSYIKNELSKII